MKRTIPSAADDFQRQSAFKWLNITQHRVRRMAVSAVFAFVITAAPICARGQVFGTHTVIAVLIDWTDLHFKSTRM
jgi:hypothetical protein